ncbi:polyprotein [Cucumis melo var. makuwa]|uniref:Polyprotein n=1 Tax=Cucumis melo var. makuwa TaxID=1194695 RepID=A0A5A7U7T9_CUCMM|nr:polyprotein [Cucumis melo var. makuwa]
MEPPPGRQRSPNQRQSPQSNQNNSPQRPQTVASSSETTPSRGKPSAQSSAHSPMSAENYAMDLQFEQVSRRRQGSAQRTLTIQSDSSSLPPIPSTALLCPSGPTTPNKRVASPAASSSRSAISRNPSSYSQIVRLKVFQPRPPINGYFTKTTMVDLTIEPEFDGPFVHEVCNQIFPHEFNFLPEDLSKTRTFYEYILVDSKSAEITHVPDKNDPSKIIYSKFRIFRVLTPSYWKQGMFVGRKFSHPFKPPSYNYRPSGNFKALSKSLIIKWWEKFNYSHLEVNKIKDWFKANIHLQNMTRQEDETFLLTKNAVMSTLAGASTQQEFNFVVNNVVVNLSDDNDDLPEDASPASVNDVDDLDYDPYEGLDINDPFLDTQPY